tara:strand:+ start:236 stop:874 length:639 start_codon:yes stop_codon:yes gene_type:complete
MQQSLTAKHLQRLIREEIKLQEGLRMQKAIAWLKAQRLDAADSLEKVADFLGRVSDPTTKISPEAQALYDEYAASHKIQEAAEEQEPGLWQRLERKKQGEEAPQTEQASQWRELKYDLSADTHQAWAAAIKEKKRIEDITGIRDLKSMRTMGRMYYGSDRKRRKIEQAVDWDTYELWQDYFKTIEWPTEVGNDRASWFEWRDKNGKTTKTVK